ncbi:glycoside hydrolase family 43 protein [Parvularcula sp. LCG005]|uniref:glycoside hydrolase family 43 protein n=1 Tax=Parvularcula sp. LCG005 TaxID=3078805 RepID=UPI0029437910|nr:glycoside hydrolase family 43 protein [Parvularcula sp. LCG005]WOI52598.1 glycoside hydrolase family 43 protein [Parvularcula sp. LCG005]
MLLSRVFLMSAIGLIAGCTDQSAEPMDGAVSPDAVVAQTEAAGPLFEWFEYQGNDAVFETALGPDEYRNPILAGYYPDPSVVAVGDDYYMVNSTFGFYPGIPVFHSQDLVHWEQLGNAIDRPDMMPFDGLHLGYNGVYAATIDHNDGTFYIANTCVACGGNFVLTADDPAGPWSDPIWLPHIPGIDPSFFFDDDGRVFIVHHGDPADKQYEANTALWVMQVDPVTFAPLSEDVMLVDGGADPDDPQEYNEGPHIYKHDGRYILSAPEGGTGYKHKQLVYAADDVFGPYTPYEGNPILTQLGLPDDRPNPVTATGHADIFQDAAGDWWAVFLAARPYDLATPPQDPGRFHTGRETFMLPVTWQDGWPLIMTDEAVPYAVKKPNLPEVKLGSRPLTGNFTVRDEFDGEALGPEWLFVRTPHDEWWSMNEGTLSITPRPEKMGMKQQPSFVGRRVQHMTASATTKMLFSPSAGEEAGMAAIQNSEHFYKFGVSQEGDTSQLIVRRRKGADSAEAGDVITTLDIDLAEGAPIFLRMSIDKADLDFAYSLDGETYTTMLNDADASVLTTAVAGGFTGAVIGMYAEKDAP